MQLKYSKTNIYIFIYFIYYIQKMKKILLLLLWVSVMTLTWCGNSTTTVSNNGLDITTKTSWNWVEVKAWDIISVNYIGRTTDGKVFDSSIEDESKKAWLYTTWRTYQPLEFTVSGWQMIPGFDKWVVGMKKGETRVIKFGPELWYGKSEPTSIITTGIDVFVKAGIPANEIKVWSMFNFGNRPGKITVMTDKDVTIDFNSQLADKTLEFEVTLVNIK